MSDRYRLSFTVGGLFLDEASRIIPLYLDSRDWNIVKKTVLQDNILQARTLSSLKRRFLEIQLRLSILSENEIELFYDLSLPSQKQLLWIAACRRYEFIGDFAKTVLRERFIMLKHTVSQDDFDDFVSAKSLWHEELTEISPTTFKRLRSAVFLIMRQADLIDDKNTIISADFRSDFYEILKANNYTEIEYFPTLLTERDFK